MNFTPEYIALCREAKVERTFAEGDYIERILTLDGNRHVTMLLNAHDAPLWGSTDDKALVWLPRLDQLLDMLEAEGFWEVIFQRVSYRSNTLWTCWGRLVGGLIRRASMTPYLSREEAALRLLLAVRVKVTA